MLTPEELAELKRLESLAEPGPWTRAESCVTGGWHDINELEDAFFRDCRFGRREDAEFICAIRNSAMMLISMASNLPALLEQREYLHECEQRWARTTEKLLHAIRKHRDMAGDDRCFQDDHDLYMELPEGDTRPDREVAVTIENCQRYIQCRQQGREYVSPQRRIEQLEEERLLLRGQVRMLETLSLRSEQAYRLEIRGLQQDKERLLEPMRRFGRLHGKSEKDGVPIPEGTVCLLFPPGEEAVEAVLTIFRELQKEVQQAQATEGGLRLEIRRLQKMIDGLAARCAGQAELIAKQAERKPE